MTRILALSNLYPPHHLGGYELSCRDVMDRFRERGHEITVLTTTTRLEGVPDPPGERALGVRRDLVWYWEDHKLVRPSLLRRLSMERANQAALRAALGESRPEVVSAWNMGAMSLGLLTAVVDAGIPLVLVLCDDWLRYGPRVDAWSSLFTGRPLRARAARALTGVPTAVTDLGSAAVFCYISDAVRRWAHDSQWSPRTETIVYNGIDRRDFPTPQREAGDKPWRWRLLCVGRLDERKGIHVAIEALALLPREATLEINGRGDASYLDRLRRRVSELGLEGRVRFSTSARAELASRYAEADVVVFPTIWEEPFGLVPVEAMACGTPVVATGTGGSGEFLADGVNCLLVRPNDAAAIASAVERLAADPGVRARLVGPGFRTAEELDIDRYADTLEAWHVAAAERFRGGRPADRLPPPR